MADLLDEDLLTFAAGIRSLPGRPHLSSGYRFISRGSRGVVLETIVVGGRRYTSRQALKRFVLAVTAAADRRNREEGKMSTPVSLTNDTCRIERDLDAAGIT